MSILAGDPLTQVAFSIFENKGVYALLLGSGLSRSAGIPTGWEITLDLVRRVALSQGVAEQADWAVWYRTKTGTEPNYSMLLAELASSPAERRSILHSYIEPDEQDRADGRKIPTAAHHAIAGLVRDGYLKVIVTTNFDRLMENALREAGVEPTVVWSVDSLAGAEPLSHSSCYILKLHGDYKDARILNTDEELSGYPPEYDQILNRIFDEHGLLICGWSGEWDHALRAAMLRAPNRRFPTFWTLRGEPGIGAAELIGQRKAQPLAISDADTFFGSLAQRVETLGQTRKQNPLSVELIVSTVKRYLAKAEHRIQLDEIITQEGDRLLERMGASELSPQGNWTPEEFRGRVQIYQAASEPLARAAGAMGRWGDGAEFSQLADIVRALVSHANKEGSGLSIWLGLRSYPALLVFTAFGLGLVRAQRWSELHDLFFLKMPREDRTPKPLVKTLFLWDWKGFDENTWRTLEGLDRRKTPLSDHLLNVFTEWGRSFVGMQSELGLIFDRFETLGALAHLEEHSEDELKATLSVHDRKERMSVGRIGWRETARQAVEQDLLVPPIRADLLKAGFAHGSDAYLDLFALNLRRVAGWMGWQ
ncbi:NAD-dependent SIR2 family protein deacetylase [Aminobacter lissarensis]|uniref:NAD-dependent SIR2 family protein deacetylase n=1 Tax=Aminobacter carboxidus TaxID=376165 RepID=A0A8E1WI72_9HYPH|nr:SIR2 family protein [Aminobacter lissarensis]MBB6469470.1 NAD-dependent SIR2 family protein deacetylase [Aminobacter lissarensis]